jgi:hypothetical protein
MMRLTLATARALLGRFGLLIATAWVFAAALLAWDAAIGVLLLGPYLAFIAVLPMLLLWRLGRLRHARRAQGWSTEERLRDPRGLRAPLAEAAATALLLGGAVTLALLPPLLPAFRTVDGDASLQPARVVVEEDGAWRLDYPAPLPDSATLLLTIGFERTPTDGRIAVADSHGRSQDAVAGEVLRFPLHPDDTRDGSATLRPVDPAAASETGARPIAALARVAVPRPGVEVLPRLLGGLLLWFLPLIGMLLALERFGRVDGGLAAVAALLLGALAATRLEDGVPLQAGPLSGLAQAVLALRAALPDVSGLYAVGHRYELRAGTVEPTAVLLWLALGAVALALACRRRGPRANHACALAGALVIGGALLGAATLPGAEAAGALRGWWTARAYDQAVLDLDWARMATLGERLLEETGDGLPLQLAAYRMGMDGTARTQGRVSADVLAWAGRTENLLLRTQSQLPDPWAAHYLQALLLVQRVYPVTGDPRDLGDGLDTLLEWMASGGGLRPPGGATGRSYRALLALPAEQRTAALRDYFFSN